MKNKLTKKYVSPSHYSRLLNNGINSLAQDLDMYKTRYTPTSTECKIPISEPTSNQLPSQTSNYMPTLEINWICNPTFHTFTKITGKSCKVVIEHDTCVYIVSSKVIDKFVLIVADHHQPHKILFR